MRTNWHCRQGENTISVMTSGFLVRDEAVPGWTLIYEEQFATEEDWDEATIALTLLDEGGLIVRRIGEAHTQNFYRAGASLQAIENTPIGPVKVSILTNQAEGKLDAEGGEVNLAYSVQMDRRLVSNIRIRIMVKPSRD